MNEQIQRVENNVMLAIDLIKLDKIPPTYQNGDFFVDYLTKAGAINEDSNFVKEEIAKPVGQHSSLIVKTYFQFGLYVSLILKNAVELKGLINNLANSLNENDLSFAEKVEIVKNKASSLLNCFVFDYTTERISCNLDEAVLRRGAYAVSVENTKDAFFDFECMSPNELEEKDRLFLEKLYELSKDWDIEIKKLKKYLPSLMTKRIEEAKRKIEADKAALEEERKEFKAETGKNQEKEKAKAELEKVNARIAQGFFPKTELLVTAGALLLAALFYFVLRWDGLLWKICFAIPLIVGILGACVVCYMFTEGCETERKEWEKKKSELMKKADPTEDDFGNIAKLKHRIKSLEGEISKLEKELKAIK